MKRDLNLTSDHTASDKAVLNSMGVTKCIDSVGLCVINRWITHLNRVLY